MIALGTQYNVDFGVSPEGPYPNTQWLLAIIASFKPDHPYFGKSFRPKNLKEERLLQNDDGFFDDLPPALTQSKNVRRSQVIKRLLKPLRNAPVPVDIEERPPANPQRAAREERKGENNQDPM